MGLMDRFVVLMASSLIDGQSEADKRGYSGDVIKTGVLQIMRFPQNLYRNVVVDYKMRKFVREHR